MKKFICVLFPFFVVGINNILLGQNYVRTLTYTKAYEEEGKSSEPYLESIEVQYSENFTSLSKYLDFDEKGEILSYSLYYHSELRDESIDIEWSNNGLGIYHNVYDSINETVKNYTYQKEGDSLIENVTSIEFFDLDRIDFIDSDDSLFNYYLNWIRKDANQNVALLYPDMPDYKFFPLRRSRTLLGKNEMRGDTLVMTKYYIDSIYINSTLDRDSVLERRTKKLDHYIGDNRYFYDEFLWQDEERVSKCEYDSLNNRTTQRAYLIKARDTIYDIELQTYLDDSLFNSDYEITGGYLIEHRYGNVVGNCRNRVYFPLDTIVKRSIHVERDPEGRIINGHAKGITVRGAEVESDLYVLNLSNGLQCITERRNPNPLYYKLEDTTFARDYFLMYVYPNFDLHPLGKMKPLKENGILMEFEEYPKFIPASKGRSRHRSKKRFKVSQYVRKRSKRVKRHGRDGIEIWREENYNGYYIREYHFSK